MVRCYTSLLSVYRFSLFWLTLPFWFWLWLLAKAEDAMRGKPSHQWWAAFILSGAPIFIYLDYWYNKIFGTIMWFEWPKEALYTDRLKRHYEAGSPGARQQANILNKLDEGHI